MINTVFDRFTVRYKSKAHFFERGIRDKTFCGLKLQPYLSPWAPGMPGDCRRCRKVLKARLARAQKEQARGS